LIRPRKISPPHGAIFLSSGIPHRNSNPVALWYDVFRGKAAISNDLPCVCAVAFLGTLTWLVLLALIIPYTIRVGSLYLARGLPAVWKREQQNGGTDMTQFETQLVITLQQISRGIAAVGQSMQRSWWQIWGPSLVSGLITVAGWVVLMLVNQKSNKNLLNLQTKELARTRILDAFDEYLEYLSDIEFPNAVFQRDRAARRRHLEQTEGASERYLADLQMDATSVVTTLAMFDARESRWKTVLDRDLPRLQQGKATETKIRGARLAHSKIMTDLIRYAKDMLTVIDVRENSATGFLTNDRDPGQVSAIEAQKQRIWEIYAALAMLDSEATVKMGKTIIRLP